MRKTVEDVPGRGGHRSSWRRNWLSILTRYGFVVLTVVIASLLRSALVSAIGEGVPFILYYPTVVLCAWFGGLGPGLLSAALGGLVAWYVFIPPQYSFMFSDPTAPARMTLFLLAGALISLLAESLHRARRQAEERETREREQREGFRVTLASIGANGRFAKNNKGGPGNPHARRTAAVRKVFAEAVSEQDLIEVAQSLTGWNAEDASGRPLDEVFTIVNEQTRQRVDNPALRAIREGTIVGLANHTLLIAKGGAEIPIGDSGAPIRDSRGRVLGAILIFRDITERRRAEDKFRLVVESAPNAIVMVDRQAGSS